MTHRALLIANSVFPRDDRISDLRGPQVDWRWLFASLTNARTGLFEPHHITVLAEASSADMTAALQRMFTEAAAGDTILVYYSGHGFRSTTALYLASRDTKLDELVGTALSTAMINDLVAEYPYKRIAVVLDCCHGGAFDYNGLADEGMYLLASTAPGRLGADGSAGGPSEFTRDFVRALLGAGADSAGAVTIQGAYEWLVGEARRRGSADRPYHRSGDVEEILLAQFRSGGKEPWDDDWWADAQQIVDAVVPGVGLALPEDDLKLCRRLLAFSVEEDLPRELLVSWWSTAWGMQPEQIVTFLERMHRMALLSTSADGGLRLRPERVRLLPQSAGHAEEVQAARRSLVDFARSLLPAEEPHAWWRLPREPLAYLHRHIPALLHAVGQDEELTDLVVDLRWVVARLAEPEGDGRAGAEADLALVTTPATAQLGRALARASHMLPGPEQAMAIGPTLASRLQGVHPLSSGAAAYLKALRRPHLQTVWSLPDEPHPAQHRLLGQHAGAVRDCAVSEAGGWFITVGDDGAAKRWWPDGRGQMDAVNYGGTVGEVSGNRAAVQLRTCAVSDDGRWLVVGGTDQFATVLTTEPPLTARIRFRHDRTVQCCDISSGSPRLVTGSADARPRIWSLEKPPPVPTELSGHSREIMCCAFSPDGNFIATGSRDGSLILWDLATDPHDDHSRLVTGYGPAVRCCVYFGQTHIVWGDEDGWVRFWDVERRLEDRAPQQAHRGRVLCCATARHRDLMATGGEDGTIVVWAAHTGTRRVIRGQREAVEACALAPDGSWLVTGGADGTVRLWDVDQIAPPDREWSPIERAGPATFCAAAGSATTVLTGGVDASRLWYRTTGANAVTIGGSAATCATVAANGGWLATGYADGIVRRWQLDGREMASTEPGRYDVTACAAAHDGSWLASGHGDGSAYVWSPDDMRMVGNLPALDPSDPVLSCVTFPHGSSIVLTRSSGRIELWSWRLDQVRVVGVHQASVLCCAVAADAGFVATGGADGTLVVWAGVGAQSSARFSTSLRVTRTGGVTGCAVSPDGARVVTVGDDQTVRIWNVSDLRNLVLEASICVDGALAGCVWLADSDEIVVVGQGGVYLFRFYV